MNSARRRRATALGTVVAVGGAVAIAGLWLGGESQASAFCRDAIDAAESLSADQPAEERLDVLASLQRTAPADVLEDMRAAMRGLELKTNTTSAPAVFDVNDVMGAMADLQAGSRLVKAVADRCEVFWPPL